MSPDCRAADSGVVVDRIEQRTTKPTKTFSRPYVKTNSSDKGNTSMMGYVEIRGRAIDDIQWSMVTIWSMVKKDKRFDPKYFSTLKKFGLSCFTKIHAVDDEKKSVYIIAITHNEHAMISNAHAIAETLSFQIVHTRRAVDVTGIIGKSKHKERTRVESKGIDERLTMKMRAKNSCLNTIHSHIQCDQMMAS